MQGADDSHTEDQDWVLTTASRWLHQIGSANDAQDHGYLEDANRMRREASVTLQELLEQHPFLAAILPELGSELDTGHLLGHGWYTILDRLEGHPE